MAAECLMFPRGRVECSLWIELLVLVVVKNWEHVALKY